MAGSGVVIRMTCKKGSLATHPICHQVALISLTGTVYTW